MLSNTKILITGATGTVALPVAEQLAKDNEVWAIARFSSDASRAQLERAGARCATVDLMTADFSALPDDFDHALHFAMPRGLPPMDFDANITGHAESVGLLMAHCRSARSFLHCSSTSVYGQKDGALLETDPLADNHRRMTPTYSLSKIAAEAVARTAARAFSLPTTIARLNVPYGDNGGWMAMHLQMILDGQPIPVNPNEPTMFTPIHTDDIVASIPGLLAAATVPATIVNWAGREVVSIQDWCTYMGEVVGRPVTFTHADAAIDSVVADNSTLTKFAGQPSVDWKDGVRRMVAALHPDLVAS